MTIIIFIIILLALVMIHEAGHFFAAKVSGVRVDEFAFGFPPKLWSKKKGETEYVFNALPIGGYVKIYGENGDDTKDKRSFVNKNPLIKIFILAAGVIMNLVLAYLLVIAATMISANVIVDKTDTEYQKYLSQNRVGASKVYISNVLENSPAAKAGLKIGDEVDVIYLNELADFEKGGLSVNSPIVDFNNNNGSEIVKIISESINAKNKPIDSITLKYKSKKDQVFSSVTLAGVYGLNSNDSKSESVSESKTEKSKTVEKKKMLGLSFTKVAEVRLSFIESIKVGIEKTNYYIYMTVVGFKDLFVNLFTKGEISKDIAGPVGIVSMTGEASKMGLQYLLSFAATLSVSLAIFNILPFPALDGGRIIFVLFEIVSRRKIGEKWQNILNGAGFAILILLMIFVTVKDVWKIFV